MLRFGGRNEHIRCAQFCAYHGTLLTATNCYPTDPKPAPDNHLQQFAVIHHTPSKLLISRSRRT
jgi:hypothetical protein